MAVLTMVDYLIGFLVMLREYKIARLLVMLTKKLTQHKNSIHCIGRYKMNNNNNKLKIKNTITGVNFSVK